MNSIILLRKQQLATTQRVFNARGSRLVRCSECLLGIENCLCKLPVTRTNDFAVAFIMAHGEYFKPSNTGQLIANVVQQNYAFRWFRTSVDPQLSTLLTDSRYVPIVIFVHDNIATERQIHSIEQIELKTSQQFLFIFIDGTWKQAKKMMNKSPYLDSLPVLQISADVISKYLLRKASHEHHLATAEVAFNLFRQIGADEAATSLEYLYSEFKRRYLLTKANYNVSE